MQKSFASGEAFCLMRYQSADGRVVEFLWNSRDGVTPFVITAKDGKTPLKHVAWQRDELRVNHLPQIGDRIFVDMTEQHARQFAVDMWDQQSTGPLAEGFLANYGHNRDAAIEQIYRRSMLPYVQQRWPVVEIVTAEMHAQFAARAA